MKKYIYIAILLLIGGTIAFFIGKADSVNEKITKVEHKKIRSKRRISKHRAPKLELPTLESTMPAREKLTELTQKIVGLDREVSISERNELVRELRSKTLTKADFTAFHTFLKRNPEEQGPQLSYHSLKNDLLVFVIDDGRFKESTAQTMIEIIKNPEQHEVMREYVLQYTSDYFERHWLKKELSNVDEETQSTMLNTMWEMLYVEDGPIAGTALIKLHEMSKKSEAIDQERIDQETIRMVADPNVPVSSRMAALSVASERGLSHLKEEIQEMVFDGSSSLSLRMSALHTVSTMAPDEEFMKILQKEIIKNDHANKLLKRAAVLAVKKLKNTQG